MTHTIRIVRGLRSWSFTYNPNDGIAPLMSQLMEKKQRPNFILKDAETVMAIAAHISFDHRCEQSGAFFSGDGSK